MCVRMHINEGYLCKSLYRRVFVGVGVGVWVCERVRIHVFI